MKPPHLLCLLFFFCSFVCLGQSRDEIRVMPVINLNKDFPKDWSVNIKAESSLVLFISTSAMPLTASYEYKKTELSIIGARKIGIHSSIAGGYLIGVTGEQVSNRFIQQFSLVNRLPGMKMAHRFSSDQTFARAEEPEIRFRYRLTSEIPLQGQILDVKELFLKAGNEYLNMFQAGTYDLEIRLATFVGYYLSPSNKIEFGIDYRIDSFINSPPRNRLWLGLNFYQGI